MKKLIVIVASLLVAVSAHAQFGVVAGITSTKSNLKEAWADVKNITQYHVGLTYKLDLGLLAIQPSILYNMKGTKLDVASADVAAAELDYKTGYIEVPVQLQLGLNLGVARIYGFAEPFIGYAITNSATLGGTDLKANWENVKNRLEYGVGLGAGVELIKHVQVSVKYFWNMGDMYGTNISFAGITQTIGEQKASGIAASVALLF
ncbi:MAG: PorT family protein [Bacteroidales bacterium]|nr:PorT family protein [Bacteroidales bacterium]